MNNEQTFGERVAKLRGNLARNSFGDQIGVSGSAIAKYENGDAMPAVDVAARIARFGDVSLDWLIGASEDPGGAGDVRELARFDVQASAGTGMAVLEEQANGHLRISEQWIARIAPKNARLGVIDIVGDSMWSTLLDGDLVVVNFDANTKRHIAGGGIFVFTVGEDLYVKRLMLHDGQLTASSDNPEYAAMNFNLADDRSDVVIHGKVIWVAGQPRPFGSAINFGQTRKS